MCVDPFYEREFIVALMTVSKAMGAGFYKNRQNANSTHFIWFLHGNCQLSIDDQNMFCCFPKYSNIIHNLSVRGL